jgi:hypothetical protein
VQGVAKARHSRFGPRHARTNQDGKRPRVHSSMSIWAIPSLPRFFSAALCGSRRALR